MAKRKPTKKPARPLKKKLVAAKRDEANAVKRLTELELRFTEQQELLSQLSEVVYAQQRALDLLVAELRQMKQKVEGDPGIVDARENERPPHY